VKHDLRYGDKPVQGLKKAQDGGNDLLLRETKMIRMVPTDTSTMREQKIRSGRIA
jgi:hypothetical protein